MLFNFLLCVFGWLLLGVVTAIVITAIDETIIAGDEQEQAKGAAICVIAWPLLIVFGVAHFGGPALARFIKKSAKWLRNAPK